MQVSVDRLRKVLLAGASLLLLVIVGFLAYAHYRTHRFLKELPRKLGADIRQETNAFTWSQTVKGRTIFTVHAAKAIQHKDGKYTMRDVGIVVYGKGEDQARRIDRIYGKEFELDQAEGVVKAMGEVHLDLQAPVTSGSDVYPADANPNHDEDLSNAKLIHVKTSGLVYLQKLGVAATDKDLEFDYNGLTGHATGADYNADTGKLLLHSAVRISGLDHGKPILLTADHGELNRMDRRVVLTRAKFTTVDAERGDRPSRQTIEAQRATAFLKTDGSAEKLLGEDGVTIESADGSKITAQRGEMFLSQTNKPESVWMTGNVRYSFTGPDRNVMGQSAGMRTSFGPEGHPANVTLNGAVHLLEHIDAAKRSPGPVDRELGATKVELELAREPGRSSWLRNARASGGAWLRTSEFEKDGKGTRKSLIRGDVLTARFELRDGKESLASVHGQGTASLEQRRADGSSQTSSADSLDATFHPVETGQSAAESYSGGGRDQVDTASLSGHVVIVNTKPPVGKQNVEERTVEERATAQKATYDAHTDQVSLMGAVELKDSQGVLWADRITLNQKTGDGAATGGVKANFQLAASGEPVHVLADHADLKKSTGTVIFYGATHKSRLWQGASQIEAPVLQFDRARQSLIARGAGAAVHTVLVTAGEPAQHRKPAVIRIVSQEMNYSNEERTAEFTGGVRVDSADGSMNGRQAMTYFSSPQGRKQGSPIRNAGFLQSGVEQVVVNGDIVIRQQQREATGDHLVYTASSGVFVLTGTIQNPPRVTDSLRGTISGRELRFREQDTSVVVSNGNGNGNETAPRVRTETRVKKEP